MEHIAVTDTAGLPDDFKDRRAVECVAVDFSRHSGRQNARDVIVQAATGDVGDAVQWQPVVQGLPDRGVIAEMWPQQHVAERSVKPRQLGINGMPASVEQNFPCQAVTVGMQPVRGEAYEYMSGRYLGAGDHSAFLNDTGNDSDQIVIVAVHARHFGSFTTEHSDIANAAGGRNAAEHFFIQRATQLADTDVVHEIQRFGALHGNVIDAVVDDVMADAVVPARQAGNHQLGADTVDTGDQHRLLVFA